MKPLIGFHLTNGHLERITAMNKTKTHTVSIRIKTPNGVFLRTQSVCITGLKEDEIRRVCTDAAYSLFLGATSYERLDNI